MLERYQDQNRGVNLAHRRVATRRTFILLFSAIGPERMAPPLCHDGRPCGGGTSTVLVGRGCPAGYSIDVWGGDNAAIAGGEPRY